MRKLLMFAISASALGLSGCSGTYEIPGDNQQVTIATSPAIPAHCLVKNGNGSWNIYGTPETLDLNRARGPLDITCRTTTGFAGRALVTSKVDPIALATVVAGTVGATALVGSATTIMLPVAAGATVAGTADSLTGPAYKYPNDIVVPMQNNNPPVPSAIELMPSTEMPASPPIIKSWPIVHHYHHYRHHHYVAATICVPAKK